MARVHMDWDWIGGYPYMLYSTWLRSDGADQVFSVKVVKGPRGNQNAPECGPNGPTFMMKTIKAKSRAEMATKMFELLGRGY